MIKNIIIIGMMFAYRSESHSIRPVGVKHCVAENEKYEEKPDDPSNS